jgi:hypothetical protein
LPFMTQPKYHLLREGFPLGHLRETSLLSLLLLHCRFNTFAF